MENLQPVKKEEEEEEEIVCTPLSSDAEDFTGIYKIGMFGLISLAITLYFGKLVRDAC
jgi:hypothetical protein